MVFKRSHRHAQKSDESVQTDAASENVNELVGTEHGDSTRRRGPYDVSEVNVDEVTGNSDNYGIIDLQSIILSLPQDAEVQVEVQEDTVSNLHLVLPVGRITVSAYAAPKSAGQWRNVAAELADSLKEDEAEVSVEMGHWGREVVGKTSNAVVRFIGVDGPRWMLRGVGVGDPQKEEELSEALREVFRKTIVRRGREAMPVREALPIKLPAELAQQVRMAQESAVAQQREQAEAARNNA